MAAAVLSEGGKGAPGAWTVAVGVVAFVVYVFTTAPTAYLLDSAELAAAGFGLGIAHPPGEALALLWTRAFLFLPLGSVAFRAGVAQAVAGAVAVGLTFRLALALIERMDEDGGMEPRVWRALAATAALGFALAPGVVLSSNRPEVYALATALALGALACAGSGDARGALLGALLVGLGVSNQPYVAGLAGVGAVVAVLPLLRRGAEAPRGRLFVLAVAFFLVGLGVLAYLPARAGALYAAGAAADTISWGDARSWAGFWWIVSGRTFLEKSSVLHMDATPEALPFALLEEIGLPLGLLALAGVAFALRLARTRMLALPLVVALAGSALAALAPGFDPNNPDHRGYLEVAVAGIAVLGAAGLVPLATAAGRGWVAAGAVGLLAVATAWHAWPIPARVNLRQTQAAAVIGREILAQAPPRAAVLTSHFETGFLLAYQRVVEGQRPDAAWIHLGLVRGPGQGERLMAAHPELAPLLAAHQNGALDAPVLLALARPVLLEPDQHLGPALRARLLPAGLLWRLDDGRVHGGAPALAPLPAEARVEAGRDRQVRGFVGWRAFLDAELACSRGLREVAGQRLGELRELLPEDERVAGLRAACGGAGQPGGR